MILNWQLVSTQQKSWLLNLFSLSIYFVTCMNYKWVSHCLTRISCVAPLSNVNWKRRNFLHFITINLNRVTINVFSLLGSTISSEHKNCWNISQKIYLGNHLQNHLTPCWTFGKTSISAISCHIKKSFKPQMCWRIFKPFWLITHLPVLHKLGVNL